MSVNCRAIRRCLFGGAALLLAACGSSERSGTQQAYVNAPQLTLVEEVRYCTDEDLPECQLTDMVFAMPAVGGRIIIGMPEGPITGFDSTGEIVARYGRQGGGPGEYALALAVHVEPDGRVVIQDIRQARRVVYAADGTPLVTQRVEPDFSGFLDYQVGHAGFAVLWEPQAEMGDSVMTEVRIHRDTLEHVVAARMPMVRTLTAGGLSRAPGFFKSRFPLWAAESDTTALLAEGPSLRIERYFSDGRMELVVNAPALGNRAVTSEDLRAERARYETMQSRFAAQMLNEQEANAATHHRFADSLTVLSDGAILLRENAFSTDSARWTMLTSSGEVIGQFTLPKDTKVLGGRRDRMLLNSRNELGVPIIAWHRAQPDTQ